MDCGAEADKMREDVIVSICPHEGLTPATKISHRVIVEQLATHIHRYMKEVCL